MLILINIFFKNTQYLIFLSIVFFTIGKHLFNGWVDGLVAVYFCLSTFLMYSLIVSENNFFKKKVIFYLIAFCFFTTLTLIKNEGIVLLLILFVVTFLIKFYKGRLKNDIIKLIYLSFSFAPIILWKLFCYSKGIGNDYINSNILLNILPRLYEIENYKFISYFLLLNEKFIYSLVFFLATFWIKWNTELFRFISFIALSYIFILFFIFLSTPHDLHWQLDSTAARVVKSLSFLFAFFGLYNLRNWRIEN